MRSDRHTILLVDDDPDYLFQMELKLKKMGFEVVTAESQREAEKVLSELKPDLCIFDLMMERDDSGFILSHRLGATHPGTPVIIATAVAAETGIGFDLESDSEGLIKANAVVDKGIRTDQLENEIRKLLTTD